MGDWGGLFQELVAAPEVDHVTGHGRTSQNIERNHTGNTCYSYKHILPSGYGGLWDNRALSAVMASRVIRHFQSFKTCNR